MLRKLLLVAALVLAPSIARAEWREASTKHFVVYSEDSAERVRTFAERLERFDATLRYLYGMPDKPLSPRMRVTVYIVGDLATIQKMVGNSNVAGYYQGRSTGPTAFIPQRSDRWLSPQEILLHEYGHSFMYSSWPGIVFPRWFSEGFAEFTATAAFRNDGSIVVGSAPDYRAPDFGNSIRLPARRMIQLDTGKLDDDETRTLYARGWLLTHYLLLDKNRAAMLANYISALNAGKSIDEANQAFGDVGALDGKLTTYIRKGSLPAVVLTPQQVPIGEVRLRTLSPGEAAVMPAQIRSASGVDPATTAREVVALARRLAAPFPNDPAAQNELAEAEFDASNYALAEAAADRALAADPRSVHALIYKGMAQMEQAKKDKVTDPAKWRAIRAWFLAANKVDTEYPWPLQLYYESFAAAGQAPTKNAQDGLVYAYALAPFDFGLRMTAGEVLLRQGKVQAARVAIEPIAFGPHSSPTTRLMGEVLAALNAKGADGALAVIAAEKEKVRRAAEEAKAGKKP